MTGFIEPRDIAFPTTTFNIFMVLMVLLGGKGTLWGPVSAPSSSTSSRK